MGLDLLHSMEIDNVRNIRELGLDFADELIVMASLRNLVVCNSTFSWWGGYFSSVLGGKVTAPRPITKNFGSENAGSAHWNYIDHNW